MLNIYYNSLDSLINKSKTTNDNVPTIIAAISATEAFNVLSFQKFSNKPSIVYNDTTNNADAPTIPRELLMILNFFMFFYIYLVNIIYKKKSASSLCV